MLVNNKKLIEKQILERYAVIKQNLIVILNEDKKPEDSSTQGKLLKDVLKKMNISETDLRNTLRNIHSEPTIEIFPVTEGTKEVLYIRIKSAK